VEICKKADPNSLFPVADNFTFTISGKTGQTYGPLYAGSCTEPIIVPVGPVTITETARSGYSVTLVTVNPSGRRVSVNRKNGSATVKVVADDETLVTFFNSKGAAASPAKISKVLGAKVQTKVRYITRTVTRMQTKVRYITRTVTRVKTVVRYVTQVRYRTITRVREVTQVRTVVNNKMVYTSKVRYITKMQYKTKTIIQHKTVVTQVAGLQYRRHPTTGRFAGPTATWHGATPAVEARMSIARLNISWASVWARDFIANPDGSLRYDIVPFYGVTRFSASAGFGQPGLTLMSGHNDEYGQIFRNLGALQTGDVIQVWQGKHTYRYVVTSKQIATPDNVSMVNQTRTRPTLALISCTPYMVDTHRVIVTAELQGAPRGATLQHSSTAHHTLYGVSTS